MLPELFPQTPALLWTLQGATVLPSQWGHLATVLMRPGALFFLPCGNRRVTGPLARSRHDRNRDVFWLSDPLSVLRSVNSLLHVPWTSPYAAASWAQHILALRKAAAPVVEGSLQLGLCQEAPDSHARGSGAPARCVVPPPPFSSLSHSVVVVLLQHDGLPASSVCPGAMPPGARAEVLPF